MREMDSQQIRIPVVTKGGTTQDKFMGTRTEDTRTPSIDEELTK